ncbi:MAG: glycosyltransferase, partial [Anaerolineae bacterium]|nr:glycosyltransferase [Anaerolineae bacterium]
MTTRVLMLSKACVVGIYQRKLEEIARLGIDLLALVPPSWRDERGETRLERVYTEGYRLETLPIRLNGNFHLHYYPDLGRRIRDFQPHIVHIDEEPYNLSAWQALYHARRAGAKTLFFSWQNLNRHYPPPFAWGERWMLRRVDYALMGTESAAAVWREKGYAGPLRVIPQFGTDPALFAPSQPRTGQESPFTIGYIGRLVEEKGLALLLEATARLSGDWRLRLIGSGPYRLALRQQ